MNSEVRRRKFVAAVAAFIPTFFLLPSSFSQTNQPAPVASAVMVNSNGVVIAPANFAAANGFGTNSGGVSSNLAPGRIYIGNALSNAAPQGLSGDVTISTNGTATLASTGTAGTYAQVTTDAKGRVTSGTTTLPISAGGTGQTIQSGIRNVAGGLQVYSETNYPPTAPTFTLTPDYAGQLSLNVSGTGASWLDYSRDGSTWRSDFYIGPNAVAFYTTDNNILMWASNGVDNCLELRNFDLKHYSAVRFVDAAGNERGAVGFGNTSAQIYPGLDYFEDYGNGQGIYYAYSGFLAGGMLRSNASFVWFNSTATNDAVGNIVFRVTPTGNVTLYNPSAALTLANGVTLTTTNGNIIKSNGTLNNSGAFDSTDGGTVHHDDARVYATNFVGLMSASHTYAAGPIAFDASGNGSGMTYYQTASGGPAYVTALGCKGQFLIGMVSSDQSWASEQSAAIGWNLDDFRTWGHSMLDVQGCIGTAVNKVTGSLTLTALTAASVTNSTILLNGATNIVILPDATAKCIGRIYTIKEIASSTGNVWVGVAGQHIDGGTNYSLSAQYKYVTLQSDGTQWWIIANN
jgi:hypothetical protein